MVNSKQKGKRGELELSHYLEERGFEARRGCQYSGFGKHKDQDADSPDVVCKGLDPFRIECKRTERFNIYKAFKQADEDCREGEKPVVFHRKSREDWLVVIKASDFLELVKPK